MGERNNQKHTHITTTTNVTAIAITVCRGDFAAFGSAEDKSVADIWSTSTSLIKFTPSLITVF
jgi:hypothetical protein